VYGVVGLKTHCKLCLVVRQEGSRLRRYAHVGTGNYNPNTARVYEDLGLLTSDQELGRDVSHLFNYLTGYSRRISYHTLIVAPHGMRERIIEMIEREVRLPAEQPRRIIMKMNGLADEELIDALYRASRSGVDIDLIVRGICMLQPGVPGLSENIRVRSILGRFLEHSRIYWFANGGQPEVYMGSADMMHRNLDNRVEALVNVTEPELRDRLFGILDLSLTDNQSAWMLRADGTWAPPVHIEGAVETNLQKELMRRAIDA
jgi:polyphosphate kinase